ncbi:hypothetical protein ACFYOA_05400 [Streptomyces iakyrus]|uniref:hypothetical protein n=1 Tax=Streptomyces iakyrus TaxID=68219 RepID=UPI003694D9F3
MRAAGHSVDPARRQEAFEGLWDPDLLGTPPTSFSYARAVHSKVGSSKVLPTSIVPTGRPWTASDGMLIAGCPEALVPVTARG